MRNLYSDYFQKSKVFLYPLLKLKKGIEFVPDYTYVAWENLYEESNFKFLCLYSVNKKNVEFEIFSKKYLKNHSLLESYVYMGNDIYIYIFNFYKFKYDFLCFNKGEYSKFSKESKTTILNFFGDKGDISQYIKSFLNPEDYHDQYADALGVSLELIKNVWELCSLPDKEKETIFLRIPEELKFFKNNSISLNKL